MRYNRTKQTCNKKIIIVIVGKSQLMLQPTTYLFKRDSYERIRACGFALFFAPPFCIPAGRGVGVVARNCLVLWQKWNRDYVVPRDGWMTLNVNCKVSRLPLPCPSWLMRLTDNVFNKRNFHHSAKFLSKNNIEKLPYYFCFVIAYSYRRYRCFYLSIVESTQSPIPLVGFYYEKVSNCSQPVSNVNNTGR